jgi:phytol kinase
MNATATITRPNSARALALGIAAAAVAVAATLLVESTAGNGAFWINQALQVGTLASVAYGAGILVAKRGLKVNYARKISFFAIFLAPLVIVRIAPYHHTLETTAIRSLIGVGMFAVLAAPIRSRVPFLATIFRSFDRPEDRPHTLLWLSTQVLGAYAVMIPMSFVFSGHHISNLMFVPVLIHGIGDGLAEPVGTRWGRHTYTTSAFLSRDRRFTRSYEGSACVFLAGVLAILLFHGSFTPAQLVAALLVVPLVSTLAEARAPHTWDTPYMFLAGTISLLAISVFV